MTKLTNKSNWGRAAAAIVIVGGLTATQATAADDFTGGSMMRDLEGIAEHDAKRFDTAQFQNGDRLNAGRINGPNVGPQALSIAVCSLNECSDVACDGSVLPGQRPGPGPQALSIAVCSLNECSDVC